MTFAAMILAAGRGERMRPLTDATAKPLLRAGGKALVVWQIEALARAGFRDIAINASHHARQLVDALGDGGALGVRIRWSLETEPLETAGGVVWALPLLAPGPALIVSGDIWTEFDYASLAPRARAMARDASQPRVHLVMVPNPDYHPRGDFALRDGMLHGDGGPLLTYGNIGLYDTALFGGLARGASIPMLPLYRAWIAGGLASGERYDGPWMNVGTPADLARLNARLVVAEPCPHVPRRPPEHS
jgi:MurNAc alpha-1-phosphate uridylyltransferase